MSAKLLNRFLDRAVEQGRLTVTYADGATASFGQPAEGFPEVALRFTDSRVPRDLLFDPRSGAGEAYMDGRILIEHGDVMQLAELVRGNNRWERFGRLSAPGFLRRWKRSWSRESLIVGRFIWRKHPVAT